MIWVKLIIFLQVLYLIGACQPGKYYWGHWSSCSQPCGGGSQHRTEHLCWLEKLVTRHHESRACNTNCYHGHSYSGGKCRCPSWRSGRCCDKCSHINIAHCRAGKQQCGGTPDNIRCTSCVDPYYSGGYGRGCVACPVISNCDHRQCTNPGNNKCLKCHDDKIFFRRNTLQTKCERLCAWNNHFCWPGTCGDGLAKHCNCSNGFRRISTQSETSCQPTSKPVIETCFTTFVGSNGEKKQSTSSSSSTACDYLQSVYGNFQMKTLLFDMFTQLTISKPNMTTRFINESKFGVTDAAVYIKKNLISGKESEINRHILLEDKSNSTLARQTFAATGNLSTASHSFKLINGEWLCVHYESLGGGYLKSIDTSKSVPVELPPTPYQKTIQTKVICFRYDDAPPAHCKALKNCTSDPLYIKNKVVRSPTVWVYFQDWFDPIPQHGDSSRASSIESYQVIVHETIASLTKVQIDRGIVFTRKVNSSVVSLEIPTLSDMPKLYCITLEVKDVADNVKQSRRFVLFDNTSYIEIRQAKPLYVKSASVRTNYKWQTHHNDLCLNWEEHFFNQFYLDNQLLNPIEPDPHGLITGVYDQIDGILPISGTENVHGIIKYTYYWRLNDGNFSRGIDVPNIKNQSYCKHFDLRDGQTFTFKIVATDIANNTLEDSTYVHIDRTVPHIKNIWLQKGDHKSLFVHDSKELSTMSLYFEALDPHSGLLNVNWAFGTSDAREYILNGTLRPDIAKNMSCTTDQTTCYCPDVGPCEVSSFMIPLNKLVSIQKNLGNHNRNYYFSIKATNNALLSNIEHVEILVDDSPPETGTVLEGSVGSPDIDYTSDDHIMVNWHGFIDHESGIKLYRVGIAKRCLDINDLTRENHTDDVLDFVEVPYTVRNTKLKINMTGKAFVTVVAMNNAMEPSKPVCSDGVIRDISPPGIRNLTLLHGGWSESIGCLHGKTWLLDKSLTKIQLRGTPNCLLKCANATGDNNLLQAIPIQKDAQGDDDKSDFLCQNLPKYSNEIIYIPDDYIFFHWNLEEKDSQVDDIYIGFGHDPSEKNSPSLVSYRPTNRKNYFRTRHEGVGSNTMFYIFLKIVGKTGLTSVLVIGPVVIDVTAPLKTALPVVEVLKDEVKVSWENTTFYDDEQTSITQILFQFVTGSTTVTPLHEWRLETSHKCDRCFMYPLQRLQAQDNDHGKEFFVKLFIYNNAGHFLEVNTEKFRLPSRYPPGQALVYDTDPDHYSHGNTPKDIDIHFKIHTLCVSWIGFRHHELLDIEIGVGTNKRHDNVVQFYKTKKTDSECINSTTIVTNQRYFVLIRARCSGGETLSSSNGVLILNATNMLDSLRVKFGKNCFNEQLVFSSTLKNLDSMETITVEIPLNVGAKYSFIFQNEIENSTQQIKIQSSSAYIETVQHSVIGDEYPFVPYVEKPVFQFEINTLAVNSSLLNVSVVQCGDNRNHILSPDQVPIYWYFLAEYPKSLRYEIRMISVNSTSMDSLLSHPVSLFDSSNSENRLTFTDLKLDTNRSYQAEVKICVHDRCLGTAYSEPVKLIAERAHGAIQQAQITYNTTGNCLVINATWKEFKDESGILFYMWAVSKDQMASQLLSEWTIIPAAKNETYEVRQCLKLPVYTVATLFLCIRGYSKAGSMGRNCSILHHTETTAFPIDIVYDLDVLTPQWDSIKQVVHSFRMGNKLKIIHDNELNIGNANITIGGAMIYASERNVSWYLMMSPHTPVSCTGDSKCIVESSTNAGFVIFPREVVRPNIAYYICVHAEETSIHREFFTEKMAEINSCSNGFILDDTAPKPGKVVINHHHGYITSRTLDVSWRDFTDNVDAEILGYPRNISYYQYKLGTTPNHDDILKSTNTSDRTLLAKNVNIKDGSTIYFTVTGFDHAGLYTTVVSNGYYVDTSAPVTGNIILADNFYDQLFSSSNYLMIHLRDFKDIESGIDHFEIGIGSSEYLDDILPRAKYYYDDVEVHIPDDDIIEGHLYFVAVTAVNRAGLKSRPKSIPVVVDRTAPIAGQIIDGNRTEKADVDFQSNIDVIQGHCSGFHDQQSGITFYRAGLGTSPYTDDVKAMVNIELLKDVSWRGPFVLGQKYYNTFEACNGAGLCRQLTSDGVILDNSPPISGLVRVGPGSHHQNYLGHNTSVRIQWVGFEDPESGIEKFEACIGQRPFSCDLLPSFSCLLQSNIIKTGINLPLGRAMYATVTAYNKVGMKVTQSSDYFIIDDSPPQLVKSPRISSNNKSADGIYIQWEQSVLRAHWKFEDKESPIVRHELSLRTHHEGHTPIEHLEVGNVEMVTISLKGDQWLHNGDTYSLFVTSCNAAGLCSTGQSNDILIDSTPPNQGGFKPPMTWQNFISANGTIKSTLMLTWYGFQDEESDIQYYFFTASKSYSGDELTGGTITVDVNSSLTEVTTNVTLTGALMADDIVVLSVWAQNNAGLNSSIGKISVNAVRTSKLSVDISTHRGILEIQKHSCEVHYCNHDCTCAVLGQPCLDYGNVKPCQEINGSLNEDFYDYQAIDVLSGIEEAPKNITASSACLTGFWTARGNNVTHAPLRYEWSAGLVSQQVGEGIFDLKAELPWKDVGLQSHFMHCLKANHTLIHGERYMIYVRAWYAFDTFMEFRSSPITVDNTPPTIRGGRVIKDSDSSCVKDFDFIDWTTTVTACWDGVFSEQQGRIAYYTVALGTSSKADDTLKTTDVKLDTTYTVSKVNLRHGTRYFFTVTAYNDLGLHTTAASDGFIIDTDNPTLGIVFNTRYHRNKLFQSSNVSMSISWHGFVDHFSSIHSYFVAMIEERKTDLSNVTFVNVGLQGSHTFLNVSLKQGTSYVGVVQAMDSAGHFSEAIRSSAATIDTTAPEGYTCNRFDIVDKKTSIILQEHNKNFTFQLNVIKGSLYVIRARVRTNDTRVKANFEVDRNRLPLPITFSHDGSREMEHSFFSPESGQKTIVIHFMSALPIIGTALIEICSTLVPDDTKAVSVRQIDSNNIAVKVLVIDNISSVHEVRIGVGSTLGGFQIRPLSIVHGGTNGIIPVKVPHATTLYVTAMVENNAGLHSTFHAEPIVMDKTAPHVYDIRSKVNSTTGQTSEITSKIVTEWKTHDDESGVKECFCYIGSNSFWSDISEPWLSNSVLHCRSPALHFQHGTKIYVTVRCVNNVELATEISSSPVIIVKQPPNTDQAKVSFMKLGEEAYKSESGTILETVSVQTNDSHIQFQWSGFLDTSPIKHYEYRLVHERTPLINWSSSGEKTMVTVSGHPLVSGNTYTAEVRAYNDKYGSEVVRANLLIYKDQPALSGSPVLTSRSDEKLHMDWSNVFKGSPPNGVTTLYSLSVGSRPGFNDIKDVQHLSDQFYDINLPESTIVTAHITEIYVSITCYFNTGSSSTYEASFKM